jgi:putative PIN family toxin of toxin-antitoxin system
VIGSWALAEELALVLHRPKLRHYEISEEDARDILVLVARDLPEVEVEVELRDPDDTHVVAAALAGRADAIVSGDHDLLEDEDLREWLGARGIALFTPAELLNRV